MFRRIREGFERFTGVMSLRSALFETQQRLIATEAANSRLAESFMDVEGELARAGWEIKSVSMQGRELSRRALRNLCEVSRVFFLRNPLINRGVLVKAIYVWAQGVSVSCEDEATQAALDKFWTDPRNQAEFTSHQARTMKEIDLEVNGNIFFVLFSGAATGRVTLRSISVDEVTEIITDPEDRKTTWLYKREWTAQIFNLTTGTYTPDQRIEYHPDWRYDGAGQRPDNIAGHKVRWDAPVYHVKVGGLSDMQFGLPETWQAIDWARSYTNFLANWCTIIENYSRFAFKSEVKGGPKQVDAVAAKIQTQFPPQGTTGGPIDANVRPQTGSTFVSSGATLEAVKTAGSTTSPEDGRPLRLQVAAAFGYPETFFGDVSVGTLATATSLDRPTELSFVDRQELWKGVIGEISLYVVNRGKSAVSGELRDAEPGDKKIVVTFPPVLQHDITKQVDAWKKIATLDGQTLAGTLPAEEFTRRALAEMGVPSERIEELAKLVVAEMEDRAEQAEKIAQQTAPKAAGDNEPETPGKVSKAMEGLRRSVDRLVDNLRNVA